MKENKLVVAISLGLLTGVASIGVAVAGESPDAASPDPMGEEGCSGKNGCGGKDGCQGKKEKKPEN